MRATLADPALTRYAGRFVWLELDYDKPVNQPFLTRHAVSYTPTLLIVDPASERALVSHVGGLSVAGLDSFLVRGERRFRGTAAPPAESLLAHADVLDARGDHAGAATAAARALEHGGPRWPQREHAYRTLTWALMGGKQARACAETTAAVAPRLARGEDRGAIVLAGLICGAGAHDTDWAHAALDVIEPLAEEAVNDTAVLRDHRFQLYQNLVHLSQARGDTVAARLWGHRWLDVIEAATPRDDDERSALDIARVDAAGAIDEPGRVLPALIASERAMPTNYNASLRLAQMLEGAKRYAEALAACGRGLDHVTGPLGRSWLITTQANVYDDLGDRTRARAALVEAIAVAKSIGEPHLRDNNVRRLTHALEEYDRPGRQ